MQELVSTIYLLHQFLRVVFTLGIYPSLHIDAQVKAFYDYIRKGLVESSFTEDLEKSIVKLKTNKMQEKHYMSMADTILESRAEGLQEVGVPAKN